MTGRHSHHEVCIPRAWLGRRCFVVNGETGCSLVLSPFLLSLLLLVPLVLLDFTMVAPRMPHNNRLSTSGALATSDIWSKTIGHDPYAGAAAAEEPSGQEEQADKAKGLLELARHQKIAGDTTSRDDFARNLYLGLKAGKKRRAGDVEPDNGRLVEMVGQESSSEDEFVEQEQVVKKKKPKRKEQRKQRDDYSSDDSSDDDRDKRRARKKKKKSSKHSKKKKRRKHESSDDESSDSEEERRRRKRKRRRREERKQRKQRDDESSSSDDDDRDSRKDKKRTTKNEE